MRHNVGFWQIGSHMVINDLTKGIISKHSLNRGFHSSPSKISLRNSIIHVLLTRIHLIKESVIFSFTLRISVLFGALITIY